MKHSRQTDKNISMRIKHASAKCLTENDRDESSFSVRLRSPLDVILGLPRCDYPEVQISVAILTDLNLLLYQTAIIQ